MQGPPRLPVALAAQPHATPCTAPHGRQVILFWRGVWNTWDSLFGTELDSNIGSMVTGLCIMCIIRALVREACSAAPSCAWLALRKGGLWVAPWAGAFQAGAGRVGTQTACSHSCCPAAYGVQDLPLVQGLPGG